MEVLQLFTLSYKALVKLLVLVNVEGYSPLPQLMRTRHSGQGGHCMKLSMFFHHMLRGLGFHVYLTGICIRARIDGVSKRETQEW